MYGAVCFARLQRCSTRLVCVRESIRWISRGACASLYLQCREAELSEGGESVQRSENPDSHWEFKSSLSLPLLPVPLSFLSLSLSISLPSLSLSRSLCCEFLLIPSLFTSLSVYVSSCPVWVSATPTAYIYYPQSCKQEPLMFPHLKGKEREKLQARNKEATNFPSRQIGYARIKRRALTINGSQEQMFSHAATPPNIVRLSTVAAAS